MSSSCVGVGKAARGLWWGWGMGVLCLGGIKRSWIASKEREGWDTLWCLKALMKWLLQDLDDMKIAAIVYTDDLLTIATWLCCCPLRKWRDRRTKARQLPANSVCLNHRHHQELLAAPCLDDLQIFPGVRWIMEKEPSPPAPDKYSCKTMFPLVGLDRGVGTNYHGVPVE